MEIKELGHVVLYVRDLERSRAFYRDVLGFHEIFAIPSAAAGFSSGRTHHELLLLNVGPDAQAIPQGRRVGMYHFGLKVGDSDDELRAARDAIYIDVPGVDWKNNPSLMMARVRPLQI